MNNKRAALEAEFLRICRVRGPEWIASVIRPLGLRGVMITAQDIPLPALSKIVRTFGRVRNRSIGVVVI
jgi:hypothetical protein